MWAPPTIRTCLNLARLACQMPTILHPAKMTLPDCSGCLPGYTQSLRQRNSRHSWKAKRSKSEGGRVSCPHSRAQHPQDQARSVLKEEVVACGGKSQCCHAKSTTQQAMKMGQTVWSERDHSRKEPIHMTQIYKSWKVSSQTLQLCHARVWTHHQKRRPATSSSLRCRRRS